MSGKDTAENLRQLQNSMSLKESSADTFPRLAPVGNFTLPLCGMPQAKARWYPT